MASFTTLTTVKQLLRITSDDDDEALNLLIKGASGMVINYLKDAAEPYINADREVPSGVIIPPEIEVATCMLVGMMFQNPDQDPERLFERGNLPRPVTAILTPLRNPAVA